MQQLKIKFLKSKALRKFAFVHFALECQFWFPVWLVFLIQKGFDLTIVVLADGVFRLTVVAMEFPMGFFSDRIGRRNSYLLVSLLSIATYIAIIYVDGNVMLFAVWILWGILWALYSGIPSAYTYELIVEEQLEQDILKVLGLFKTISNTAILFSYFVAGFLMTIRASYPFVANIIMSALALILVMQLPKMKNHENMQFKRRTITQFFKLIKPGSPIVNIVIMMAVLLILFWSPRILMQPLFIELSLSPIEIGLVYFAYALAGIVAGLLIGHVNRLFGYRKAILLGFVLILVGIALVAAAPGVVSLAFLPFLTFGYTVSQTLLERLLHDHIENWYRASILSMASFLGSVVIVITRPALGIIADEFNSKVAFFLWAIMGLVLLLLFWRFLIKIRDDRVVRAGL